MKKLSNLLCSALLIFAACMLLAPVRANAAKPAEKRLVIGSNFDFKYDKAKGREVVTGFYEDSEDFDFVNKTVSGNDPFESYISFGDDGGLDWSTGERVPFVATDSGMTDRKAEMIFGIQTVSSGAIEPISPDKTIWESSSEEGDLRESGKIKIEPTGDVITYNEKNFPVYMVTLPPAGAYSPYSKLYVSVWDEAEDDYDRSIDQLELQAFGLPFALMTEESYADFSTEVARSNNVLYSEEIGWYACDNVVPMAGYGKTEPEKYYLVADYVYPFVWGESCSYLDLQVDGTNQKAKAFVDFKDGNGKKEKSSTAYDDLFTITEYEDILYGSYPIAKVYEITFYPGHDPYTIALPMDAMFDNGESVQAPIDMRIDVVNDFSVNSFFKYEYDKNLKKDVISGLYSFNGEEGKLTDEEIFNVIIDPEFLGSHIVFLTETDLENKQLKAKFVAATKDATGKIIPFDFNEDRVEFFFTDMENMDNNTITDFIPFSDELINVKTNVKKNGKVNYNNKSFDIYDIEFDISDVDEAKLSALPELLIMSVVSFDGLKKPFMFLPFPIVACDKEAYDKAPDPFTLALTYPSASHYFSLDYKENGELRLFSLLSGGVRLLVDDETGEPIFYVETEDGLITDPAKVKEYVKMDSKQAAYYDISFTGMMEDYTIIVPSVITNAELGISDAGCKVIPSDVRIRVNTKFKVTTEKVDEVKPGCETDGVKAYYKGSDGKFYLDADAKIRIKDLEAWKKGDGAIKALGHKWEKATLKKAKTCSTCGKTEGWKLEKVKDITYNIISKSPKKVEVVDVNKKLKKVTIGKTVTISKKKYNIVGIAADAFKGKTKLTEVKIGDNVTSIGNKAFYGCSKLKKVTLGKKVSSIGDSAFAKCKALTSITIPSKVKSIGASAFSSDSKLTKVTIKSTALKSVGKNAFKGIGRKAKIYVPKKKFNAYVKLLTKAGVSKKMITK